MGPSQGPASRSSLTSGQHTPSTQRREGSFLAACLPSPASQTSACLGGLWPCSVQSQDICKPWGDAGTSWQLLRRGLGPLPIPTLSPRKYGAHTQSWDTPPIWLEESNQFPESQRVRERERERARACEREMLLKQRKSSTAQRFPSPGVPSGGSGAEVVRSQFLQPLLRTAP